MNIGKRTSWQIAAVTAAALFAGIAQAGDRGHSGKHDGNRDRHGWHDQGRYENGWHDRGSRQHRRGHGKNHWAPPPPRHWHKHHHQQRYGYSSRSSWPYALSGTQLTISVPLY